MPAADARSRLWRRVSAVVPERRALADAEWWSRHRTLVWILWGHVAVLSGWWAGAGGGTETFRGLALVTVAAIVATTTVARRRVRALAVTLGLLGCTAVLVDLSGGSATMEHHAYLVLALLVLYRDWAPFLLATALLVPLHPALAGFVGAVAIVHLMTWRVHERAGAHAEQALSLTGEGIYGIDEAGVITFANPAAARMVDRTVAELIGRHHHGALGHGLVGAGHPPIDECVTCVVIETSTGTAVREHLFGSSEEADGFPVEFVSTPVELRGNITGAMVAFRDVTDRAELHRRAYLDALTGLPNRTLLLEHLDESIGRRRRTDSIAVLFLDLDRFKAINDTLGHAAGDALLVGVAARLRQVVRPSDTVGRLGGDEFVVVCEGVTDRDHAAGVAHRVLSGFDEPFDVGLGEAVTIRPSIGVFVPAVDTADTPDDFLRKADAAMYRAKQQGRARVELFDDVPAG